MSIFKNKAAVGICLLSVFSLFASAAESYGPVGNYGNFSSGSANAGPFFVAFFLAVLAVAVLQLIAMYKVFEKAGKPGWAAIVPVYNTWVLAEVGGKPGWMGIVAAVISAIPLVGPIVSLVLWIMILLGVSNTFGRGTGFGIGLVFLPFVFFPILAFGSSTSQQFTTRTEYQQVGEEIIFNQQGQPQEQPQEKTPVHV